MSERRIVVAYSGGVTSAWALGWALREFPRQDVIALFHDTQMEDVDTYRYLRQMAQALDIEITERSDGRSVEQVEDDEHALANNRMAFCSRILKVQPRERYFDELRAQGITDLTLVLGMSAHEDQRIERAKGSAWAGGYTVRFPVAELGITKQSCAYWSDGLGVPLPRMYRWSDHANCVGCRRGGKAYWLAVKQNAPDAFERAKAREAQFGHTFLKDTTLARLEVVGLKRRVERREPLNIDPCECGE